MKGGAEYLDVKWRLVWLREEHPDAEVETRALEHEPGKWAAFSARVALPGGGSGTGHGSETATDFRDYYEKAETKALGRALAVLGYGTQFVGEEMDEGARIVDSPVERPVPPRRAEAARPASAPTTQHAPAQTQPAAPAPLGPGVPENIMTHSMDMAWRKFAEGESADAAKAVLRRLWSQADQRDRDFILSEITKLDADEAARNAALDTPAPVAPSYAGVAG